MTRRIDWAAFHTARERIAAARANTRITNTPTTANGAITCAGCGLTHEFVFRYPSTGRTLCGRCMSDAGTHTREFPNCDITWHDGYDHDVTTIWVRERNA